MNLDNHKKEIKIEIQSQAEQLNQIRLLSTLRHVKGLKIYEYNLETNEIVEAEFQKTDVKYNDFTKDVDFSKRVVVKDSCLYIQALNKKNVVRKIIKLAGL